MKLGNSPPAPPTVSTRFQSPLDDNRMMRFLIRWAPYGADHQTHCTP